MVAFTMLISIFAASTNYTRYHFLFMTKKQNIQTILVITFLLLSTIMQAQSGIIKGRVTEGLSNEPIPYATIVIQGTTLGATTDTLGNYEIQNLSPGTYNVDCSTIGFKKRTEYEIAVDNNMPAMVNFSLEKNQTLLKEVSVTAADKFYKMDESPVSVRNIGVNEIQRNPGSNRDISKVIQNLPGVAGTLSFRNDLLVRGGGPSENHFYMDGIEIPNINHFATQGSTGGPVGLLNVDFIREADFYSGAFPANRGNSLSSILELKNKEGRTDHWGGTFTGGYTSSGLSLEGPIGTKSSLLISIRQSYLQVLFKQIGLPFLPTFSDYEFKYTLRPDRKNEITILGLGAIDKFAFNADAVTNAKDSASKEYARYILNYLPSNNQNSNTFGVNWRHYRTNGYSTVVVSRNYLDNMAQKFFNNDESNPSNLVLKYASTEAEIKARIENTGQGMGMRYNYGIGWENATYTNATYNRFSTPMGLDTINFNSRLTFRKYSAFAQLTKGFAEDKLKLSVGVRTDFNDYSASMANPLKQISPRLSVSWQVAQNAHLNMNVGSYYQLPGCTVLGYRDSLGILINKGNDVTYIQATHVVIGGDYFTTFNAKFSIEGFVKLYDKYPFSITNNVSLANLGGDFGVLGNEPITSTNKGRAYGIEFSYQQKLYKGFYGILTYTYVRSEFQNEFHNYIASSWDYQNIINMTIGKKLKRNWEVGAKIKYQGGQPFTPYDELRSLSIPVWSITQQGIPDYTKLNSLRTMGMFDLDIRIDKKYLYKKWALIFYVDVQNALNTKTNGQPFLSVLRDVNGNPIPDPAHPGYYIKQEIANTYGVFTPNVGIIVEF